jgi:hypothetical protein
LIDTVSVSSGIVVRTEYDGAAVYGAATRMATKDVYAPAPYRLLEQMTRNPPSSSTRSWMVPKEE